MPIECNPRGTLFLNKGTIKVFESIGNLLVPLDGKQFLVNVMSFFVGDWESSW